MQKSIEAIIRLNTVRRRYGYNKERNILWIKCRSLCAISTTFQDGTSNESQSTLKSIILFSWSMKRERYGGIAFFIYAQEILRCACACEIAAVFIVNKYPGINVT